MSCNPIGPPHSITLNISGMGSLSQTMEDELNCLLNLHEQTQTQKQTQTMQKQSFGNNHVKIQKVPSYLREREEFCQYYSPKLVSIGPIHHPKGEEHKKRWASTYINDKVGGKENAQKLLESIGSEIQQDEFYSEDVIHNLEKDKLSWMLFVDGCALLHIIHNVMKSLKKIKASEIIAQYDLLLLENQLPYQVLKILSNGDDSELRSFIKFFLESRDITEPDQSQQTDQPAHLLDLLLSSMVKKRDGNGNDKSTQKAKPPTHRNVQELVTTSPIIIKKIKKKDLTSISFSCRTLYIPPFTVDDFTAQIFLNMIAFEMCPDNNKSNYETSNYVSFLNSLIDHADDVKQLRKAGVLKNHLGSDEEVAKVFNTISTDLVLDTGIYNKVKQDIEKIYEHTCLNWLAQLQRNHFNTPWTIIGLISAIIGFILSVRSIKKEFFGPHKD